MALGDSMFMNTDSNEMLSVNRDQRSVRTSPSGGGAGGNNHLSHTTGANQQSAHSQMAQHSPSHALMLKFRGCLAGGLVGDCLGSPFENDTVVPRSKLEKFIAKQLEEQSEKLPAFQVFSYTDDTAMAKSIAQSLIEMKKFDPKDMAKRFTLEYNKEPKRGYGGKVVDIFAALMLANYDDPFGPASRQFNGKGSYGNGGAMRASPIAMYGFNMDTARLVELARDSARITHSNSLGYNGAVLQVLAVHQALHTRPSPSGQIDIQHFLDAIIDKMSKVELETSPSSSPNHHPQSDQAQSPQQQSLSPTQQAQQSQQNGRHPTPYTDRLRKVKEMLLTEKSTGNHYPVERIVSLLGNDVSALKSVPTAIYAALKSQLPIDGFDQGKFVRTLFYACNLGGDVDTIASMACSIAGALYGYDSIPRMLRRHCESIDIMEKYADDLFMIVRQMKKEHD